MHIKRVVGEGEKFPIGYGFAYSDDLNRRAICYPIPLNLVIGGLRHLYWQTVRGVRPAEREQYEAQITRLNKETQRLWQELSKLRIEVREQSQPITYGELKKAIGYTEDWEEKE